MIEELKNILLKGERHSSNHLIINEIKDGFEIDYGRMYDAPVLNFSHLKQLSELFGTDNIDVDNYSQAGCDSCDWGSSYGHKIQIRNVTKSQDSLKGVLGKDLYKDEY